MQTKRQEFGEGPGIAITHVNNDNFRLMGNFCM
jgi:hypothetical protein